MQQQLNDGGSSCLQTTKEDPKLAEQYGLTVLNKFFFSKNNLEKIKY